MGEGRVPMWKACFNPLNQVYRLNTENPRPEPIDTLARFNPLNQVYRLNRRYHSTVLHRSRHMF